MPRFARCLSHSLYTRKGGLKFSQVPFSTGESSKFLQVPRIHHRRSYSLKTQGLYSGKGSEFFQVPWSLYTRKARNFLKSQSLGLYRGKSLEFFQVQYTREEPETFSGPTADYRGESSEFFYVHGLHKEREVPL